MPTRNVVLTERQETLIEALVQSGRYQNASEVMRAKVCVWSKKPGSGGSDETRNAPRRRSARCQRV